MQGKDNVMERELIGLPAADENALKIIATARKLTRDYNFTDYEDKEQRNAILKELFGKIGENVAVDTPFYCNYGKNIDIGDNVIININCTFVDDEKIRIGNQVLIASNVQIYTATHSTNPEERLVSDWKAKGTSFFRTCASPVIIEDNVWIGGGSILLPGVTIGKNSVIGAGSVVNRSIPENSIAVGNPCRVIRYIKEQKRNE